jgi:hypothetical protein
MAPLTSERSERNEQNEFVGTPLGRFLLVSRAAFDK